MGGPQGLAGISPTIIANTLTKLTTCGTRHRYLDFQYSPAGVSLSPGKANILAGIANRHPSTHRLWCPAQVF